MSMREWQKEIAALLIVGSLSLWRVWPLVISPTDTVLNGDDGVLTAWILDSVTEKLINLEVNAFWNGNIFYPYHEFSV